MQARFVLFALLVACGGHQSPAADPPRESSEEKVTYEKLPDGRIKKTTTRTTRRSVPAPPPPSRAADPWPADPLIKYNVDRVNAYRAKQGLPALLYDGTISAFARRGSEQLAHDHNPHAHFAAHAKGAPGFGSRAAENQGDPGGVPALDPNLQASQRKQIDTMLELMMNEGPGGGHYDNMMSPQLRRIGVGLVYENGRLYMTNDFSD